VTKDIYIMGIKIAKMMSADVRHWKFSALTVGVSAQRIFIQSNRIPDLPVRFKIIFDVRGFHRSPGFGVTPDQHQLQIGLPVILRHSLNGASGAVSCSLPAWEAIWR
jgi:hypothetical protein